MFGGGRMHIIIRNTGDVPIYEQIVTQIKSAIVSGELTPRNCGSA